MKTALTQMDQVTQSAAASAEQSAAASEQLNSQAEQLNAVVQDLVTLVGSALQDVAVTHAGTDAAPPTHKRFHSDPVGGHAA